MVLNKNHGMLPENHFAVLHEKKLISSCKNSFVTEVTEVSKTAYWRKKQQQTQTTEDLQTF